MPKSAIVPSVQDVEQIIELRLMVQDAQSRAKHSGRLQRLNATVLLDAAVERAVWIVYSAEGVEPQARATYEDQLSQVVGLIAERWKPSSLADLKLLHKARNLAQHHGLPPDPGLLPGWSSAVEKFAVGIVDAVFDVDLLTMTLASALEDPDLQAIALETERLLGEEDYPAASKSAAALLDQAIVKWDRVRRGRARFVRWTSERFYSSRRDPGSKLQASFDEREHREVVLPFVQDHAEVDWYLTAARDQAELLDRADVERMLAFSFAWAVGYEAAARAWTTSRRRRRALSQRNVRRGTERARVGSVEGVAAHRGCGSIVLTIVGVPGETEFDAWREQVHALMDWNEPIGLRVRITDEGRIHIQADPGFGDAIHDTVRLIDDVLRDVDGDVVERLQRPSAVEGTGVVSPRLPAPPLPDADGTAEQYNEGLDAVRSDLPTWVRGVRLVGSGPHECLSVELSGNVQSLQFVQTDSASSWRDIAAVIRDQEGVVQAYTSGAFLTISPVLDPSALVQVLRAVDEEVAVQIERRRLDEATWREALAECVRRATDAINEAR